MAGLGVDEGLGAGDGLSDGLGDGDGVGIAGDSLASEGDGVETTWLVGPGVPQAHAIEAMATAMPILTRAM